MYTSFLAELYFSQSVTATLVFLYSGDIIHINISTSVGGEPTNAACAPSTATSDVLNHYTIEASPKKDAQIAYITALFEHLFWGCLDGVMVKDVRRCSARRARRIRGFAPHRSRNIYMDYVSTVQKDKCRCYRLREI